MENEPKPSTPKPIEATILDLFSQSEFKNPEKSALLHTLLENIENGKMGDNEARATLERINRP